MFVSDNNCINHKGGENMEVLEMSKEEIMKNAISDFSKVQRRMLLAKKENATETYEDLKDEYIDLKALLTSLGVNLTEIDKVKE